MSLIVTDLSVHHGAIRAINSVTFEVEVGEMVAVVGANGAGKTTLLRALSGLNRSVSGSAKWNGKEILHTKPELLVRRGISHVSEGKSVIPELSVRENLTLGAIWRRNPAEAQQTRQDVLEVFPRLAERIAQPADTLSGGERQMLAIGRAIMSRPHLLLLDEPSLGLAPLVVAQIFQSIRELAASMKLTVILVEQNAMSALKIADKGIVLHLGAIAAQGSAKDLVADSKVRSAYLGY
ncbi:MAG: ABC transporter ATP-binding protein [Actinobacteria bacterium]|nr:ABC transporter ATP-binding protein [Actinomycetota bacterium]